MLLLAAAASSVEVCSSAASVPSTSAVAKVLRKEVSDFKVTQVNHKRVRAAILTLGKLEVPAIESACREAFHSALTPAAVYNLQTTIEQIRKDAPAQNVSPAEDAEWQAAVDKVQQVVVPAERRRKRAPPVEPSFDPGDDVVA